MIAHTPGPWEVHAQASANNYVVLQGNKWLAAIQFNGELMEAKQKANASLFAAAPELLDVLNSILALDSNWAQADDAGQRHWSNAIDQARAIVAKAEGGAA
jgi:hypothetical protein